MDPTQLTLAEASRAIAAGAAVAGRADRGLSRAHRRARRRAAQLCPGPARRGARRGARGRGRDHGRPLRAAPLHGIPIGLKDIYKTRGIRTTAGSRRLPRPCAGRGRRDLGRGCAPPARSCSASRRRTNSRSAAPISPCPSRRRATRGTPRITRPARRAARRRRSPPVSCAAAMGSRHRRLDPRPGRLLRHRRAQADLWPGQPARRLSALLHARPLRAADPHGRGLRDDDAGARRLRPARPGLGRCPGPGLPARAAARLDGMRSGSSATSTRRDAVAGFGPDSAPSPAYVAAFDAACRTLESLGARLVDLQLSPLIDYRRRQPADHAGRGLCAARDAISASGRSSSATTCSRGSGSARFSARPTMSRRCASGASSASNSPGRSTRVDAVVSANATGPAPAHRRRSATYTTFERASYTAPYNLTGLPGAFGADRLRGRACRSPFRSPASRLTRPA